MDEVTIKSEKRDLLATLRRRLEERLHVLLASQRASQAGAVHEEARAEHTKDTRATEASYLARGLADRAEQLDAGLNRLGALSPASLGPGDPIHLGALVGVQDEEGREKTYFIVPVSDGEAINGRVRPVTPESPLGRELIGRCVGEEFELDLPVGRVLSTIVWAH